MVASTYRIAYVLVGLLFVGIRASDTPLLQAMREKMPLERLRELMRAADSESLRMALHQVAGRAFELEERRSVLEELLRVGEYSQQDLDQALGLAADSEERESVQVLQEAGADAKATLRHAFARSGMVEPYRVQSLVDMQLVDPAEVMELALLNNLNPYDLGVLKDLLFDQPEEFIAGLLGRARAKGDSELVHKLFEKEMITPSRIVEYARETDADWLRPMIEEISTQFPAIDEPSAELKFFAPELREDKAGDIDIKQRHFPISLLIEQDGNEGIITKSFGELVQVSVKPEEAMLSTLEDLVDWDHRLIIASRVLTCGLLVLAHTKKDDWYNSLRERVNSNWKLYHVPNTQFTVWVPNEYAEYYAEILNIAQFQRILTGTKEEVLMHCPSRLVEKNDPRVQFKKYSAEDLEKIFKSKAPRPRVLEDVARQEEIDLERYTLQERMLLFQPEKRNVFDVYLTGHGASGYTVAGLPVSQDVDERERLTSLLTFLSEKVDTGIVYVYSCQAGGRNITLVQARNDAIPLNYNYVLIVGAVTDKPTIYDRGRTLSIINRLFTYAPNLARTSETLNNLLRVVVDRVAMPVEGDVRGYAAFPQVWLPGQLGFQGPHLHKDVLAVGKVTAAVHAQMGRALEISEPLVVLWYPKLFNALVRLSPVFPSEDVVAALSLQSRRLPLLGELAPLKAQKFRGAQGQEKEFPVLHSLIAGPQGWAVVLDYIEDARRKLYPEFVLMDKSTPRRLWFKRMELVDGGNPLMGILRFLRDTFGDTGEETEPKDIFIEQLEGINDFPIHMEALRLSIPERFKRRSNAGNASPLELLLRPTAGQRITLHNIMIRIGQGQIRFYIEYGGHYWLYIAPVSGSYVWHFQKTEAPPIEEFKRALATYVLGPEQKTVREVLEKKLKQFKEKTSPE